MIVYERNNLVPLFVELKAKRDIKSIFKDHYEYGNVILFRERKYNYLMLSSLTIFRTINDLIIQLLIKITKYMTKIYNTLHIYLYHC